MKSTLAIILRSFSFYLLIFCSSTASAQWPPVPAADLSKLNPTDFTDDELDIPYYLKHFSTVANSILETGPDKGYINISVWRSRDHNKTYNARIMESILSIAWFYCTNRPWNQYYNSPAVRVRLEAALDFWCRVQNSDGRFSEYGPKQWNLPATAFATKFMGETLRLLKSGPPIDEQLHKKVIEANRKAIMVVLTNDSLYNHGKNYSNQYTNVFAGGLAFLSLFPDKQMEQLLLAKIRSSKNAFQSPAGFFYEAGGVDFGYNFNTHHSNLWMAYHYSKGQPINESFVKEERDYYDWIAYNAVREPSGYYTINRAVEMRQRTPVIISYFLWTPLGEVVEGVRAYQASKEEKQDSIVSERKALVQNWPNVPPLKEGEFSAFSPYAFLHRNHYKWNPSAAQKKVAIDNLPFNRSKNFIHQKMDDRSELVFTYIRKPAYYAVFNSGKVLRDQQRLGLGLLWHPDAGSFFQSQTASDSATWGTKGNGKSVYEATAVLPVYEIDGKAIKPVPGPKNLETGEMLIRYAIGNGNKSLRLSDSSIDIKIDHKGEFTEYIPLLLRQNDKLELSKGIVVLRKDKSNIRIQFDRKAKPVIQQTSLVSGNQKVVVLLLKASITLEYSIEMN